MTPFDPRHDSPARRLYPIDNYVGSWFIMTPFDLNDLAAHADNRRPGNLRGGVSMGQSSNSRDRPGLSYDSARLSNSIFDDYSRQESLMSREAALDKKIRENEDRKREAATSTPRRSTKLDNNNVEEIAEVHQKSVSLQDSSQANAQAFAQKQRTPHATPSISSVKAPSDAQLTPTTTSGKSEQTMDQKWKESSLTVADDDVAASHGSKKADSGLPTHLTNKFAQIGLRMRAAANLAKTSHEPLPAASTVSALRGGEASVITAPIPNKEVSARSLPPESRDGRAQSNTAVRAGWDTFALAEQPAAPNGRTGPGNRSPPDPVNSERLQESSPASPGSRPSLSEPAIATPPTSNGLLDDPKAFMTAARSTIDSMKAASSAQRRSQAEQHPDQEHVTFFEGYAQPETREGPGTCAVPYIHCSHDTHRSSSLLACLS